MKIVSLVPSLLLAPALGLALVACGGVTPFQGQAAVPIVGTPPAPPPPPPPPAPKVETPPPAPSRVEVRDNKIVINEKIQFEVSKAIIRPESNGLLEEIASTIKKNPQIKKILIEGHASAEGDAAVNLKLSDERAKAVMNHLVTKGGVSKDVLSAKGFGVTEPIADNNTPEGREKNRRVEFTIVEQEVTQKKVEVGAGGQEKVVEEKKSLVSTPVAPPADAKAPAKPGDKAAPKADAKPADKAAPKADAKPADKAAPKADAKPADKAAPKADAKPAGKEEKK